MRLKVSLGFLEAWGSERGRPGGRGRRSAHRFSDTRQPGSEAGLQVEWRPGRAGDGSLCLTAGGCLGSIAAQPEPRPARTVVEVDLRPPPITLPYLMLR